MVVITAFATVDLAVESMRQGAFDFITKPFQPEVVRAAVSRACERTRLRRENVLLKDTVVRLEGSPEIYGSSAAMQAVRELIARVAPTDATVLITGETGTGKELVARAIHKNSPRAPKPFVAVNCAAFTETLLESELFGHEKGAFTGADRSRQGLFEAAHQGTLFLDEVAEMSPAAQAKLLRVVTDGQVLRVGTTQPRKVDVRLLAATHRDLPQRVREGLFRQDLYYRLGGGADCHSSTARKAGGYCRPFRTLCASGGHGTQAAEANPNATSPREAEVLRLSRKCPGASEPDRAGFDPFGGQRTQCG